MPLDEIESLDKIYDQNSGAGAGNIRWDLDFADPEYLLYYKVMPIRNPHD